MRKVTKHSSDEWGLMFEDQHNMVNKGDNKFPNYEQSYKGKVKTHKYIHRQNQ
jgi:hypothetical protein